MKALKLLLESEKLEASSLRVLFEQDGATTLALTSLGWDVLDLWLKLRDLAPRTGRWPLLVDDDYPTNRAQFYAGGKEPKTPHYRRHLDEAEHIDFGAWLRNRHEKNLKMVRDEAALDQPDLDNDDVQHFRGLLKGDEEFHGIQRGKWSTKTGPGPFVFEAIAVSLKFTRDDMKEKEVTLALL